jgi:transposase
VIHCGTGALLREISMAALRIRQDYSASDLRQRAARERDTRASLRLLAIANALEGMTRAEAARLAGMERQALHDAILRFNTEGPDGLHDRPRTGRPEQLSPGQQAALKAHILRGPEPERVGVSAWRLIDLCEHVERTYGVSYSEWGLSCLLKRLNLSRQKTRPSHPKGDPAAQAAFKKGVARTTAGPRSSAS